MTATRPSVSTMAAFVLIAALIVATAASPLVQTAALVIALVAFALVLRWHGTRQWRTLDWRVVKIPQWHGRTE